MAVIAGVHTASKTAETPAAQAMGDDAIGCDTTAVNADLSMRHGRACPGHPRLGRLKKNKPWMPGIKPGMTSH
jgi:hypothetical protein